MSIYMTEPAAYLFDMDGLLLDTERVCLEEFVPLLVARGYAADEMHAFFLGLVGSSEAVTHARLVALMGDAEAVQQFQIEWRDRLRDRLATHVPLRPGVADTLTALRREGARLAVVTSTFGAAARHHLTVAGLIDHFEIVIGGDEVTANKPDPAPYLQAAAALGVTAAECAAFEDSNRGIASAVRAGCRAVQVPDLRVPDVPLPDLGQHVSDDLSSAVAMVRARDAKAGT
ncbi:MAG: HAD family phosphatase [Pseudomonadota bacterium]